jgi:hypothetical protein
MEILTVISLVLVVLIFIYGAYEIEYEFKYTLRYHLLAMVIVTYTISCLCFYLKGL